MFINVNSLKVKKHNASSYTNLGDYIIEAKYGYNKLWSSDSGRNLAGTQTGTLVGIFPKITVQFKKLTKAQLETIAPILDSPYQTVSYYDPNKQQTVEMKTYTGDYEVTNKHLVYGSKRKNEGFSISFIATNKRT